MFTDKKTAAENVKLQSQIKSLNGENTALKLRLSEAFTLDGSTDKDLATFKSMVTLLTMISNLDSDKFAIAKNTSKKDRGTLTVEVINAKTKRRIATMNIRGKDEWHTFGKVKAYDFTVNKATVTFDNGVTIEVPKALLSDIDYTINNHISEWAEEQSKEANKGLDKALKAVGA